MTLKLKRIEEMLKQLENATETQKEEIKRELTQDSNIEQYKLMLLASYIQFYFTI